MTALDSAALDNAQIAASLRQAAELLRAQGANPFRVGAYRKAADAVRAYAGDLRSLFERKGLQGLDELPGVGAGIAAAIGEMLRTGRWSQLERLRGSLDPVQLFRTVPGVGPALARRIHDTLAVDTLEGLEAAAHDGRLEAVPGVGERRAAAIRATLAALLEQPRLRRRAGPLAPAGEPPVAALLDVDREYREKAARGALPTIAPKRFNPDGRAWLPVLHASRGDWHFTALFSNTARAHELGRTHDWVVLYFYDGEHFEAQRTVVTEARGRLAGRRVVRGREAECEAQYGLDAARPGTRKAAAG
jgi:hypothetical protein